MPSWPARCPCQRKAHPFLAALASSDAHQRSPPPASPQAPRQQMGPPKSMPPKGPTHCSGARGLGNLALRGHGSETAGSAATPRSRWDSDTHTHSRAHKAPVAWPGCHLGRVPPRQGAPWEAGLRRPALGSSQGILCHRSRPASLAGPTRVSVAGVPLGEPEGTGLPTFTAGHDHTSLSHH